MSENGKYTFTYWNIPGRGESIRALMAIGGLDFEENFVPLPLPLPNPEDSELIPFDDGTWGQMKNSTPWGSLPTLTLPDGRTFGQQRAILRYLAKTIQYNGMPLYPTNAEDALLVDGFLDVIEDIWPVLADTQDPIEKAPLLSTMLGMGVQEQFLAEQMDKTSGPLALKFDHIERAASNEGPYLLGGHLSVADVFLFAAICWWGAGMFPSMDPILADRPKIKRSIESVGALENLRKYYAGLKDERQKLPTVGEKHYADYYGNFHALCGI